MLMPLLPKHFTRLLCHSGFFISCHVQSSGNTNTFLCLQFLYLLPGKHPTLFATAISNRNIALVTNILHKLPSKFTKYPASVAFATPLILTQLWNKDWLTLMLTILIFTTRQNCKHRDSSMVGCIQQLSIFKINFHCFIWLRKVIQWLYLIAHMTR